MDVGVDRMANWLRMFLEDGQVTELRAFKNGKPVPGTNCLYRDVESLAKHAISLDKNADGIYFTPNPVNPSLLPGQAVTARHSCSVKDIVERRWFLIDVDPARIASDGEILDNKIPTTDSERMTGWDVAAECAKHLENLGIRGRLIGDSGNGWHVCYPVLLPVDDGEKQDERGPVYKMYDKVLTALDMVFGHAGAHVDVKPKDAPRIWKLYGTTSCKGVATANRPHRTSRVYEGVKWDRATAEQNSGLFETIILNWAEGVIATRKKPSKKEESQPTRITNASDNRVERAKAWLRKAVPAISGRKGHDTTWSKACTIIQHLDLNDSEAEEALQEWNGRCDPPWSASELRHKIQDAQTKQSSWFQRGDWLDDAKWNKELGNQQPATTKPEDEEEPLLVCAADIEPEKITWLWHKVIPRGMITVFAGPGGLGKSFILLDMIARLSSGSEWADGQRASEPMAAIYISGEDHPRKTLVPRLIKIGADRQNVFFLSPFGQKVFALQAVGYVRQMIKEAESKGKKVGLIVVDPPASYMGGVDDYKNTEVRSMLHPLGQLAEEKDIALIFNTHVRKSGSGDAAAIDRVMGSAAWTNLCRIAYLFCRDCDSEEERVLFLRGKTNITKPRWGLAYQLVEVDEESDDPPEIRWLGKVDISPDDVMNKKAAKTKKLGPLDIIKSLFNVKQEWLSTELNTAVADMGGSIAGVISMIKKIGIRSRSETKNGEKVWYNYAPDDWPYLVHKDIARDDSEPFQ